MWNGEEVDDCFIYRARVRFCLGELEGKRLVYEVIKKCPDITDIVIP